MFTLVRGRHLEDFGGAASLSDVVGVLSNQILEKRRIKAL